MKLLSLFDGSGGFPLAGALCGIEPTMASEVEPYPIAVTRSRFPKMTHLGDVSKINGAEIEPVDLITFGSPCQDLSVAGKRAGLKHEEHGDEETTRSGLFMEAIRIIKEMREATNGTYPTFALWENVPGAFSSPKSNKGEDFRAVLEEFIKIIEPTAKMPAADKNGWPYADVYVGDGWSVAYRTLNAQYWGVPQRRRRIYLVADLRGERAGKILFERESLYGYTPQSREEGQGTATHTENSSGAADPEKHGIGINGQIAGTLDANYYKGCGMRQGMEREVVVTSKEGFCYSIDHAITTGGNSTAQGSCVYDNICPTQKAGGAHAVCYCIDGYNSSTDKVAATLGVNCGMSTGRNGVMVLSGQSDQATIAENSNPTNDNILIDSIGGQAERAWSTDKAPTLKATHYKNPPCVMQSAGFKPSQGSKAKGMGWETEKSPTLLAGQEPGVCISFEPGVASRCGGHVYENISGTLRANPGDNQMAAAYSIENHPNDSRVKIDEEGKVQALTSRMGTGGGNVPMVMEQKIINLNKGDIQSKTVLDPSGTTPSLYAGECRGGGGECYVLDALTSGDHHAVALGIDRAAFNQGENAKFDFTVSEEQSSTLVARGPNAVCYWDGSQKTGTLTANNAGGAQRMPDKENFNCVIQEKAETQYIVRRLTPTECARLQGFPDGWGEIDPKEDFTDEEYKFWYEVRNTHAAINGRKIQVYTKQQMLTWYNKLHTDSAEYKMWGNGIALPTALYVMQGISEALKEQERKN